MEKITTKGWLKICSLFFLLGLQIFLTGCGLKLGGNSGSAFDLTGSWFIYNSTTGIAGEQGPGLFTFTTSNGTIGGTTSQGDVITGTASNVSVSFSWVGSDGVTNHYSGTVGPDGHTMQGTWYNTSATNSSSGTWIGLIDAAPSATIPISPWVLTTSGPQGVIDVTFTQAVNNLTVTIQGQQNSTGTISYLNLVFFAVTTDGTTYTYTGTIDAAATSMSGTWTNTSGQSGSWTAKKF